MFITPVKELYEVSCENIPDEGLAPYVYIFHSLAVTTGVSSAARETCAELLFEAEASLFANTAVTYYWAQPVMSTQSVKWQTALALRELGRKSLSQLHGRPFGGLVARGKWADVKNDTHFRECHGLFNSIIQQSRIHLSHAYIIHPSPALLSCELPRQHFQAS